MIGILQALADSFRYKTDQTGSYTLTMEYAEMADDLDRIIDFLNEEEGNRVE